MFECDYKPQHILNGYLPEKCALYMIIFSRGFSNQFFAGKG